MYNLTYCCFICIQIRTTQINKAINNAPIPKTGFTNVDNDSESCTNANQDTKHMYTCAFTSITCM